MAALKTAGELMPPGLKLRITGIGELPIYNFDVQEKGFPAPATKLRDEILAADALLFASPEYNWTVGAPLKNAIDWMSRFQPQPFNNKPSSVVQCDRRSARRGEGPVRSAPDPRRARRALAAETRGVHRHVGGQIHRRQAGRRGDAQVPDR